MFRWKATALLLLVSIFASLSALAQGEKFPSKPLRVIVPFPAGGLVDGVARLTSSGLGDVLRQSVLVDNRPGAGGSIGAAAAATAAPDGHTILLVLDPHAINHHLYKSLPFDTFKSFTYVTQLVGSPQLVAAATNFKPSSLKELIEAAKAKPDGVSYGSIGSGSSNHLNALVLQQLSGTRMLHVPYKGGAPLQQDVIGGQINIAFLAAPTAFAHIKAGRMKALAVGSAKRLPQLPDVPTLDETFKGFLASAWIGVALPAGAPAPVVTALHGAYQKVLADPGIKEKLIAQGFEIVGSSAEAFTAFVKEQSEILGKVIRDNNLTVE
jgi:tripartite-type tricarboxylate transporter receptor subunit TctC